MKKRVRKFSKSSLVRFQTLVCNIDWISVTDSLDLHSAFKFFLSLLFQFFDSCFPFRTIRLRSGDPEWVKASLKVLIDDRDRAYSRGQWPKYLRLRNEVNDHIRHLKSSFIKCAASANNSRSLWKSIRCIGRNSSPAYDSVNNFSAEDFNNYFSSNFQTLSPVTESARSDFSSPLQLSEYDVFLSLRKLRSKGTGPDGLPPWIFKKSAAFLTQVVTNLFNRSLSSGVFPSCLKMANITPVQKCNSPKVVSDFRPISILPVLSKIFERLVLKRFILPTIKYKIQADQFAYIPREGSGTTCALTYFQHKILKHLDTPGAVRVMSIDFRKAFDKSSHVSILEACRVLCIDPGVIQWLQSYLTGRQQRVRLSKQCSNWVDVMSGVPQGSVLGPVLFCVLVNTITPSCSNTDIIKYADDVVFLHYVRTSSDENLQSEWDSLISWSQSVSLPINYEKSCVMDIVTKRNLCFSPVAVNADYVLKNVESFCYLGVSISSDLKWNVHVNMTVKKACRRIFLLRNLRRGNCSSDLLFLSYVSFIRSILVYAFPSFCNLPDFLLEKLIKVERRCFRIMNLNPCDFSSLVDVCDSTCSKLFNSIQCSNSHPLRSFFTQKPRTATRSNISLSQPRTKTERFKKSFIKFCK